MEAVLYIHGLGGAAAECEHYRPLFPGCEVTGLDYKTFTPWETGPEIRTAVQDLHARGNNVILIANSIGAFFSLHAGIDDLIGRAYFISPVADMEAMIAGMMAAAGVTEPELREKGVIPVPGGEPLSWEYLCYVRAHPVRWNAPAAILCGSRDDIMPYETIAAFAKKNNASLTVMEGGEHWFHTEEQLAFLDGWITKLERTRKG